MYCRDMTLPMVTCPLCCRPGFSTSDSLCSALVDITTRKLCCPICNFVVVGLDKFTIHLFSHSVSKQGIQTSKDTLHICSSDNSHSKSSIQSNVLGIEANSPQTLSTPCPLKVLYSTHSSNSEEQKPSCIPDGTVFCFRGENGQIFTLSSDSTAQPFKNVTINTQNYISNTNITTSTVQTNLIEKVQKRKYSQVFEPDVSEHRIKNDVNSSDSYYNIESINSWPSTSSTSPESEKLFNNTPENEFESCKDLLTKGDFSTLSDEISELDKKKNSSLSENAINTGLNIDDKKSNNDIKEDYACDLCTIKLPNKTILAMHKQLIHKKVEVEVENKRKLLDCSMCSRTFSLRSSLMIHRKVAHAGGFGNNEPGNTSKESFNKYPCNICGKFFKKHMKAHDEKQWQCTICFKTFTTKYFLKKHRRLHTGETPYKCNKCDKSFTFQQSYHKHLLYHNDEKPYCCAQCGRLFKELSTLHNHERIHSGEKPFKCETCDFYACRVITNTLKISWCVFY